MTLAQENTADTFPTEMALDSWLDARHPKLRKLAPKLPVSDAESPTPLSYVGTANLHGRILRILRELSAIDASEAELDAAVERIINETQQAYQLNC